MILFRQIADHEPARPATHGEALMTLVDNHEAAGERSVGQVVFTAGGWSEFRQRRMYRAAVVALGVVLEQELPVGFHLVFDRSRHREAGQVESAEPAEQPLEGLDKRLRLLGEVDEQESL